MMSITRLQKPYTTQYMSTIRLTITPEIRQVLDGIKLRYPPLSEPEILKIALSEFYAKNTTPSQNSSISIEKLTQKGRNYFAKWLKKQGKNITSISEDEAYEIIKKA